MVSAHHVRPLALALAGSVALSVLGVGCASSGGKSALTNAAVEAPVVAVLPFTYTQSSDQGANSMRMFEAHYFPARLISNLRATPGVKAAYFSPTTSPAADYNIKASIVTSNGRKTMVTVRNYSANGKQLWMKQFAVTASPAQYENGGDPTASIWSQVTQAVVKTRQKPGSLAVARVNGYAAGKGVVANDRAVETANKGAEVERSQLLDIYTQRLLISALSQLPVRQHLDWQRLSTPVVMEKSAAQTQMAVSLISGMATAGLGGYAASQGAYTPQFSQLMTTNMMTAAAGMETASTKIEEANKTLSELNLQASVYKDVPISVHIYGAVYSLKGLPADQLKQLHEKISEKVTEAASSSAPAASAPAAAPSGVTTAAVTAGTSAS